MDLYRTIQYLMSIPPLPECKAEPYIEEKANYVLTQQEIQNLLEASFLDFIAYVKKKMPANTKV